MIVERKLRMRHWFRSIVVPVMMITAASVRAADPTVDVQLTCNAGGTLTVTATGHDTDSDLVYMKAILQRYSSLDACTNSFPSERRYKVFEATYSGVANTPPVTETLPCTAGKHYAAVGHVLDNANNPTITRTGCCQCLSTTECGSDGCDIPTTSGWGLGVMGILTLTAATLVIRSRALHL